MPALLQLSPFAAREAPRKHCDVLVVDDDAAILALMVEALRLEGYDVRTASNGAEALQLIQVQQPDLVLLDMRMPVMDGWTFAREVQQRGLRLNIVAVTAAQNARRWAEEINANDYLAKPFDLADLLTTVERFCA